MDTSDGQPAYRWVIVAASALILAVSMGATVNGLSAFIVPMQDAFGWQRGDITLINFSGIMGLALGGLVMGPLADRKGTRPVVLGGVIVLGLSYLAASQVTSLWQFCCCGTRLSAAPRCSKAMPPRKKTDFPPEP